MLRNLLSILVVGSLLLGCQTTQMTAPLDKAELSKAIAEAEERALTRGVEYTVTELEKLTFTNPTDAEPWSRMAKVYFDQEEYGQAIVAADEALQRNPNDFLAKSIWVVGGLRLAQKGLMDMKNNAQLAGGAQKDAAALAEAIRNALGQNIFPSNVTNTKPNLQPIIHTPRSNRSSPATSGSHQAAPVAPVTHQAAPPAYSRPAHPVQEAPSAPSGDEGSPGNSNPFGLLLQ